MVLLVSWMRRNKRSRERKKSFVGCSADDGICRNGHSELDTYQIWQVLRKDWMWIMNPRNKGEKKGGLSWRQSSYDIQSTNNSSVVWSLGLWIAVLITVAIKAAFVQICIQTRLGGQYNGKWPKCSSRSHYCDDHRLRKSFTFAVQTTAFISFPSKHWNYDHT